MFNLVKGIEINTQKCIIGYAGKQFIPQINREINIVYDGFGRAHTVYTINKGIGTSCKNVSQLFVDDIISIPATRNGVQYSVLGVIQELDNEIYVCPIVEDAKQYEGLDTVNFSECEYVGTIHSMLCGISQNVIANVPMDDLTITEITVQNTPAVEQEPKYDKSPVLEQVEPKKQPYEIKNETCKKSNKKIAEELKKEFEQKGYSDIEVAVKDIK